MNKFWETKPPIEIVRTAAERPEVRLVMPEKEDLTHKQKMRKLVMTTVNRKHKDGRIHSTGKDGKYASHTVSPYSKVFFENIEDGVKELVEVLVKRDYLPISSCASHSLTDRRFVALCFVHKINAMAFIMSCADLDLPHLNCQLMPAYEYLNTEADISDKGVINGITKKEVRKELASDYLQHLFMRKSDEWWLVHMNIMPDLEKHTLWEEFKRWCYKKFFLERHTRKIINHFNK